MSSVFFSEDEMIVSSCHADLWLNGASSLISYQLDILYLYLLFILNRSSCFSSFHSTISLSLSFTSHHLIFFTSLSLYSFYPNLLFISSSLSPLLCLICDQNFSRPLFSPPLLFHLSAVSHVFFLRPSP